jgi:polyhydroxyalkanoate synthesis regulator phasin
MATRTVFGTLRARGEELVNQVGAELMANPHFMKAMEHAFRGKEKLDQTVGRVLKNTNIPTRSEFKRALGRIETLERELESLKQELAAATAKPRARRAAAKPKARE